jgi:glycosyltransferase involved in cell wall biosynthesis
MSDIKTLCLTTHNRTHLLRQTLDSITASQLPDDITLYVYDDASAIEVDRMLQEFAASVPYRTVIKKRPHNMGCNANVMAALRETVEMTGDEFIFNFDSDAVFRKDWYTELSRIFRPLYKDKLGAVSLFNASRHAPSEDYNPELYIKPTIGGLATLIRGDIIKVIPDHDWDWKYCEVAHSRNLVLLCTKKSYVDHIGWNDGVHAQNGPGGDKAVNFTP